MKQTRPLVRSLCTGTLCLALSTFGSTIGSAQALVKQPVVNIEPAHSLKTLRLRIDLR